MMMALCLRLEQRLELQAPIPQDAVRGIEGMKVADRVLKKYKVAGMLVGGLAKEAWHGATDPSRFSKHKDVDVLVLARGCGKHPKQGEAGVDWWISHKIAERPTNGFVGLIWNASLAKQTEVTPGLYLCPLEFLESSIRQERRVFGKDFIVHNSRFSTVSINEFPVLPMQFIRAKFSDDNDDISRRCKPY